MRFPSHSPYERRPLRDLGAVPTLLLARPLLAVLNRGEDSLWRLTRDEFRQVVRRPDCGIALALGNFFRIGAWMLVALGGLAAFILALVVRGITDTHQHPALLAVLTVLVIGIMYASGAILVGGFRAGIAWVCESQLDRRFARAVAAGRRPRGVVVWLSQPSHLDMVPAGLWALALTLALYEKLAVAVPG